MRDIKPRRQSARWLDADCPKGVLAIYDNPKFLDRYTVMYAKQFDSGWVDYRACSKSPRSAWGIGLYCQMKTHEARAYRDRERRRACKWSALPEEVKSLVRSDLEEV